jgi:hypothetical protein
MPDNLTNGGALHRESRAAIPAFVAFLGSLWGVSGRGGAYIQQHAPAP